jgi:isopropylmalate/homocitrate/citramalate synthase
VLKFDKKTNVLEQRDYVYKLRNVRKPQLFEDIFLYDEPPKIPFNHRIVPMHPPEEIWITDTTFRDGQQARPPYSVRQIVDLYDMLHRLGGPKGIIRQSEFFLYSDKDKEAVRRCQEKGYRYPEITGWIRAVKEDFQLVKEMGLKETGILTSCSDYHIFLKLKKNRKQAMEGFLEIVRAALEVGVVPRCHLEDITRADFYGFVVPFVQALMRLSEESGIPIKIRACDTLGYGVPYVGASLPRGVPEMIYGLIHYGRVPPERLEWHGHNDFHKVLINASAAWLYGCCAANATMLGFGERTGNTPIEGMVMEYIGLRGTADGMDTTVINEIAEYFREQIGVDIPANYPLVGADFNATSAGIHVDGVLKNEQIYNIFNTAKVLGRPLTVKVTDKSGVAGVTFWVKAHVLPEDRNAIDKRHPGIHKIAQWVEEEYRDKRTTAISDAEMLAQARQHLPEYFPAPGEVPVPEPVV